MEENELIEAISILNITACRLYDAIMVIAHNLDPDLANEVESLHEQGKFMGSPPLMVEGAFGEPDPE